MSKVEPIKDTIQAVFKELSAKKNPASADSLQEIIKRIFSRKEMTHAQPSTVKNGVLYMHVDSSTWLYYFNLHKQRLLERASREKIKDLRFRLGEIPLQKLRGKEK